jgi:hypothetical protein
LIPIIFIIIIIIIIYLFILFINKNQIIIDKKSHHFLISMNGRTRQQNGRKPKIQCLALTLIKIFGPMVGLVFSVFMRFGGTFAQRICHLFSAPIMTQSIYQ